MSVTEPRTASDAVRSFSELSHDDVLFAGGKGANLGELTAAGLPVPAASSSARRPTPRSATRTTCASASRRCSTASTSTTPPRSARRPPRVREMVEAAPLPDWLADAIRVAYRRACADGGEEPAVAVRSSATAEDTESASFAGMNETYLNIRGADAVLDAVRRCWASLFGGRTVFYRAKRGFGQADMDIAVVVQLQIASTRSGVMFTSDPSRADSDLLVIEGSFGLGEAVVSGSVTPDRYLVDKSDAAHRLARGARARSS